MCTPPPHLWEGAKPTPLFILCEGAELTSNYYWDRTTIPNTQTSASQAGLHHGNSRDRRKKESTTATHGTVDL